MNTVGQGKVAITWLEVLLIALLVISGMGIWAVVDPQVRKLSQGWMPQDAVYQAEAGIPEKQSAQGLIEAQLESARAALIAAQGEFQDKAASLDILTRRYPELLDLPEPTDPMSIPASAVRAYVEAGQAETRVSIELLQAEVGDWINQTAALARSVADLDPDSLDYLRAQAELEVAERQLEAAREALVSQGTDLQNAISRQQSLIRQYPALSQIVPLDGEPVPGPIWEQFDLLMSERVSADTRLGLLEAELAQLETDRLAAQLDLEAGRQEAARSFSAAQAYFAFLQNLIILGITALLSVLYLLGVAILMITPARAGKLKMNRDLVLWGAALVLLVLVAYQTVGLIGAALAATLAAWVLIVAVINRLEAGERGEAR